MVDGPAVEVLSTAWWEVAPCGALHTALLGRDRERKRNLKKKKPELRKTLIRGAAILNDGEQTCSVAFCLS